MAPVKRREQRRRSAGCRAVGRAGERLLVLPRVYEAGTFSASGRVNSRRRRAPAECLSALIVNLLDDRAVLTLEDMVSLGKIGGNVVRQIRTLEKILAGWVGTDDRPPQGRAFLHDVRATRSAMLHVCRRSLRNGKE
jgi:hypothetical protein